MKKNIKKILTTSLIASFALTTALGVSVFAMPKAETDFSDFTMDAGAGVRMDTPTGIRFTANVGEKTKASLENATDVTFGMLIAPTTGADGVLKLDDVTDVNVKAKNLVTAVWADGSTNWTAETAVKYNGAIVGGETVDFPKDEYATALNAVGYVKYTVDSVEYVEYTTSMANRSLAQAAANALANGMADTNGVLAGICDVVVESVSFADETVEMTQNQTISAPAIVTVKDGYTSDSISVVYKSSNTAVATVDKDGNVTAVGAGSATITASVGNIQDTLDINIEIQTGLLNDCATTGNHQVHMSAWYAEALMTIVDNQPVGVPSSDVYTGFSTNNNYACAPIGTNGQVAVGFKVPSLFNAIDQLSDDDYVGIWMYCQSNSAQLQTSYACVSQGRVHAGNNVSTSGASTIRGAIPTNEWTMIKIPVSAVRTMMATKDGIAWDTIGLDLRPVAYSGDTQYIYFYSVDLYRAKDVESYNVVTDFLGGDNVYYREQANKWDGNLVSNSGSPAKTVALSDADYDALVAAGYKGSLTKKTAGRIVKNANSNDQLGLFGLGWNTSLIQSLNTANLDNAYLSMWIKADQQITGGVRAFGVATEDDYMKDMNGDTWVNANDVFVPDNTVNRMQNNGTMSAGKWYELKLSLAQWITAYKNSTHQSGYTQPQNIFFELDITPTAQANIDIYSLEIVYEDLTGVIGGGVETKVSALNTANFAQSVEVYDAQAEKVTDYTFNGTLLSGLASGEYTLKYTVTGDNVTATSFTRKLSVSAVLASEASDFVALTWCGSNAGTVDVTAPTSADGYTGSLTKTTATKMNGSSSSGAQISFAFDISALTANEYAIWGDNDYISIWFKWTSTTMGADAASTLNGCRIQCSTSADYNSGSKATSYDKCGFTRPNMYPSMNTSVETAKWINIKIYKADIATVCGTTISANDVKSVALYSHMKYGGSMYVYSAEFVQV